MRALLTLLLLAVSAAPGWAAGPLTYALKPVAIAPDTWVFEGTREHFTRSNGGNILNPGFIVTDDGVIVIQTGPSRRVRSNLNNGLKTLPIHLER